MRNGIGEEDNPHDVKTITVRGLRHSVGNAVIEVRDCTVAIAIGDCLFYQLFQKLSKIVSPKLPMINFQNVH